MPKKPSVEALKKIATKAHIPAVGYAYVEQPDTGETDVKRTALSIGSINAQSPDIPTNSVDDKTQFPASSLSKIVFTYMVLKWANTNKIKLDEPLHKVLEEKKIDLGDSFDEDLKYKRFVQPDGGYPLEANKLTIENILSHTSGLPNVGSDPSSRLSFSSEPGETYNYSGEAIFFLQKIMEATSGKTLDKLAKAYVFDDLRMDNSTFVPQVGAPNVVKVHTALGKQEHDIYIGKPPDHAAGSLMTTADDFSKFMSAWLVKMDDETFKKAFKPHHDQKIPTYDNSSETPVCGLGWHLYQDEAGKLIAYQYGENTDTRSFVAINVTDKKGAAFFTNCAHGMSIGNEILNAEALAPIGNVTKLFQSMPHYPQSDEAGWKETLEGKMAEDRGDIVKAKFCFAKACFVSNQDSACVKRLAWFNAAHSSSPVTSEFEKPLDEFAALYTNEWGDRCELSVKEGGLVYEKFGVETKLIRISETAFLPEKDQSFKISIDGENMIREEVSGEIYHLSNESSQVLQHPPTCKF